MTNLQLLVTVAEDFDPSRLFAQFTVDSQRVGDNDWTVTLDAPIKGLGLINASGRNEVLNVGPRNIAVSDGWEDWQPYAGPNQWEMHRSLLPNPYAPGSGPEPKSDIGFRYALGYVYDPRAQAANRHDIANLGLTELSDQAAEALGGKGSWMWKAIKVGGKVIGPVGTIVTALQITQAVWNKVHRDAVVHTARMDKQEVLQRIAIELALTRADRLNNGSAASRKKARDFYKTLDLIIAASK